MVRPILTLISTMLMLEDAFPLLTYNAPMIQPMVIKTIKIFFQIQSRTSIYGGQHHLPSSVRLYMIPNGSHPNVSLTIRKITSSPHKILPWGGYNHHHPQKTRTITTTTTTTTYFSRGIKNEDNDATTATKENDYNDDAFGLILLTALFVAKDVTFCVIFVTLSFVAVVVTRMGDGAMDSSTDDDRRLVLLPVGVAFVSFLLGVIVSKFDGGGGMVGVDNVVAEGVSLLLSPGEVMALTRGQVYELVTCVISLIYVLIRPFLMTF